MYVFPCQIISGPEQEEISECPRTPRRKEIQPIFFCYASTRTRTKVISRLYGLRYEAIACQKHGVSLKEDVRPALVQIHIMYHSQEKWRLSVLQDTIWTPVLMKNRMDYKRAQFKVIVIKNTMRSQWEKKFSYLNLWHLRPGIEPRRKIYFFLVGHKAIVCSTYNCSSASQTAYHPESNEGQIRWIKRLMTTFSCLMHKMKQPSSLLVSSPHGSNDSQYVKKAENLTVTLTHPEGE